MINKTIHYCRFGKNKKPSYVNECIKSWKKFAPDYKIKERNENNCDINCNSWVKGAYKAKKYAFISDFFRLNALYNEGGVYLDTDMKLVSPLNNLINNKYDAIRGFDSRTNFSAGIIASVKGHRFLSDLINIYNSKQYNGDTINSILNNYFPKHGIELNGLEQYSQKYNAIFYEANKISVDVDDGNAVIIDLHANSWIKGGKIDHTARCYLDYLALHNEKISVAINQIHAEYRNSMTWKLGSIIVNILKVLKLDKIYNYIKNI